jgi:HAD superfamily hydrolase (TIGR01509 family)
MLEKADLSGFNLILCNEDVEKNKPAPDPYLKAMELLGVLPSETLVLEDSEKGLISARAAGCHVWHVAGPQDITYENLMDKITLINRGQ